MFKSITFDKGKEFGNWKQIANETDIDIYFADVGAPNQRGLNENCNGLLRHDGLSKKLDFRNLPDELVNGITARRNRIPRKSLNYKTPIEVFMAYITDEQINCLT
jgi:IS30 family transposase